MELVQLLLALAALELLTLYRQDQVKPTVAVVAVEVVARVLALVVLAAAGLVVITQQRPQGRRILAAVPVVQVVHQQMAQRVVAVSSSYAQ
jgi:hypothetical protein